jgi:DNA-binding winged helix-turn-helix (wHTH) protein
MRFTFGNFILDCPARQLTQQGEVVPLEPKMYELLELLLRRHPAVVTNNELDEILWPQVYVARSSLARVVSELRAVLGDSPRESRYVRTVHKTGYAFCANVVVSPRSAEASAMLELVWNGRPMPLPDGETVAGRGAECSLVVDAETVSRRHARILVSSGDATIEDLHSTNGTHVNGLRICTATRLVHGSEIALGSAVLMVRSRESPVSTVKVGEPHKATAAPAAHAD